MQKAIKRIGVAVKFDQYTADLMRWARATAAISPTELVLIHVADPWTSASLASTLNLPAALLQQAVNSEQAASATQLLQALRSQFTPDTEVICDSRSGDTVTELIAAGQEHQLDLMVMGCPSSPSAAQAVSSGSIHTLLQIAHHEDRSWPLLAVQEKTPMPMAKENIRILVADDLRSSGNAALDIANRFVRTFGALDVYQLHIRSNNELQQVMDRIKEDYQGAATDPEVEPILAEHRSKLENMLAERSASLSQLIQSQDGTLRILVATGQVAEQVGTVSHALFPHFIVVGMHQISHRDGVVPGQLPLSRVLQNGAGLVIV